MNKTLRTVLLSGTLLALACAGRAQTAASLTNLADQYGNPLNPTPGPDDVYQLDSAGVQNPPGLNYYTDRPNPAGQTFTTGGNANGYILTSLSVFDAGGSGSLPANGQAYLLRIYAVSGSNATPYATYISPTNVIIQDSYWLQWTNLGAPLLPNTHYAYSFARVSSGSGWANLGNTNGNPYPGGQVVQILPSGGLMTFSSTNDYDAAFDAGLTPATALTLGGLLVTPGLAVTNGTVVTITPEAAGPGLNYQWQTDGGAGGTLTNVPGANGSTLQVDTTGLPIGVYRYDVVITNSASAVTSTVVAVSIPQPPAAAALTDAGTTISSGPHDISQTVANGGGAYDGLNYYDDNGANNGAYAGQTFTTSTNAQGYYLTSVAIETGGGGSSGTGTLQPYDLLIYEVSGANASLIAHYTNASFSFTFNDWLVWSGFSLTLKPNTTYAYGFGRAPASAGGTGWAGLNTSSTNTDLYPGGQICVIPTLGGTMTFGQSGKADAVFDVGLLPIGVGPSPLPFAQPITAAPSLFVTAGTQVTLTEYTTNGQPPLHYQWQTDGGSGTLTNIPASDTTNIVIDTTGWKAGAYQYDVIVNNTYGSSTSAVAALTIVYANTTASLTDLGTSVNGAGLPATDVSQLSSTPGPTYPDGLNYYIDNASPPGQTFTTGNSPAGYVLSSLTIALDENNISSLPAGGQPYILRVYTVSGGNATLYATYTSQTNFIVLNSDDWVRWSGLSVPLAPNTTYAYTFARGMPVGYLKLGTDSSDLYAGGQICLIPANGGGVHYGNTGTWDNGFVLGLTLAGYPVVSPPVFSPSNTVYAGTPVTMTADVSGTGPFTYQWMTDGGSGGALTNIPGATGPTFTANTTGMDGLAVQYALAVGNAAGVTVGEASLLTVNAASAPISALPMTNSLYQGPFQVTTFVGGSVVLSDTTFEGTLPITYQWQADGGSGVFTNIVGQTTDILVLTNLKVSDSGNYQLTATNSQGTSQISTLLTVMPQPSGSFIANFQFVTLVNTNVGTYSGTGVIGTGTYWNQVVGPSVAPTPGAYYTSSPGYSDDGSVNEGISWTLFSDRSWGYLYPPNNALLDQAANAYGTNNFLFTLPNGIYKLVLFSCSGNQAVTNGQGTVFTVNGVSQTALPTTDTSFILNNNYVVFNNVAVRNTALAGTWAQLVTGPGNNYGSLNGAQIQYIGPLVELTIQPAANNQLKVQWPQGTLLQATNITGPWTTNTATSPYLFTPSGTQQFFRVQVP